MLSIENTHMKYSEVYIKYRPLVKKIISKYPIYLREDLEQEACFALYKASLNWCEERGASFDTLAYIYIQRACNSYMQDKSELIRTPVHKRRMRCASLDQLIADGISVEFSSPTTEDQLDSVILWNTFSNLMEAGILKRSDIELLYYKYIFNYSYERLGSMFNCSKHNISARISTLLQKLRPYFFGRKKI